MNTLKIINNLKT